MSRKALIIGNNAYSNNSLRSCVYDARDLAGKLNDVGFEVVLKTDLISLEMYNCIKIFIDSIQPNDFIIFFFAGYGVQWGDQNFLLPCDNEQIESSRDMQRFAISAQEITNGMAEMNPQAVVVLLDCCREYWVPRTNRNGFQVPRGLAKMDAPPGTLIAFACASGHTIPALFSDSKNSTFTKYLLKHITTPDTDIDIILRRVTRDISIETNNTQKPYRVTAVVEESLYVVSTGRW